jgi:hypothetical protein
MNSMKIHDALISCSRADLQPGKLGMLFKDGGKAGIVKNDPRIKWLWDSLFGSPAIVQEMSYPWNCTIEEIAQNHQKGSIVLGDMVRFIPGQLGYIARKSVLFKDSSNELKTIPGKFYGKKGCVEFTQEFLQIVWEVMHDVLQSMYPQNYALPAYAIKIELLKYPKGQVGFDEINALLGDISGIWTKIGRQLDKKRAEATGFLSLRVLKELYAFGHLIPGVNNILDGLNKSLPGANKREVSENAILIGEPHVDNKILTALISDRDVIKTQVYDEKQEQWVTLPLTIDSLAFFPARLMNKKLKISPTLHRILLSKTRDREEVLRPNITLNLSVVPWPPAS